MNRIKDVRHMGISGAERWIKESGFLFFFWL